MSASENAPDLISEGIVHDVAALPIYLRGEPRPPDKSAQKQILDGPGLKQSSITDP